MRRKPHAAGIYFPVDLPTPEGGGGPGQGIEWVGTSIVRDLDAVKEGLVGRPAIQVVVGESNGTGSVASPPGRCTHQRLQGGTFLSESKATSITSADGLFSQHSQAGPAGNGQRPWCSILATTSCTAAALGGTPMPRTRMHRECLSPTSRSQGGLRRKRQSSRPRLYPTSGRRICPQAGMLALESFLGMRRLHPTLRP